MSIETALGSAVSFVEKIGTDIMHGLTDASAIVAKVQPVANFVGTIISAVDPALAPAVTAILGVSSYVEGQFAAAGNASGTGEQKLSIVTSMIGNVVANGLTAAGKASDAASVQAFISDIVNIGKDDPNIWQELLTMLGQSGTPVPTAASAAAAAASAAHS
jgi:hypothetical protein